MNRRPTISTRSAHPLPSRTVVRSWQSTRLALCPTWQQRCDTALIQEGRHDVLVEPRRAPLIPGFAQVKAAALDHGALGASISGGVPSVFAWFAPQADAEAAAPALRGAFADAGFDAPPSVPPSAGPRADALTDSSNPIAATHPPARL